MNKRKQIKQDRRKIFKVLVKSKYFSVENLLVWRSFSLNFVGLGVERIQYLPTNMILNIIKWLPHTDLMTFLELSLTYGYLRNVLIWCLGVEKRFKNTPNDRIKCFPTNDPGYQQPSVDMIASRSFPLQLCQKCLCLVFRCWEKALKHS